MFPNYFNQLIEVILREWKMLSLLCTVIFLYYHYTSTFKFFEKKNVKYLKPRFLIGNLGQRLLLKISLHDYQKQIYNEFKGHKCGGLYEGKRPILMIFDQELIKSVLIRDFDHFTDRNSLDSKEPPYLKRSLLNLKGNEWKSVRSILTPTFSSSRLRGMMPLIQYCSSQLVELLKEHDNKDVEMKRFFGYFTLEVIGVCAFGIKCDVLNKKNSQYLQAAEKCMTISMWKRIVLLSLLILMPKAFRFINFSFLDGKSTRELVNILTANKKERRSAELKSHDFLQLMIDASNNERNEIADIKGRLHLDDDTIDAQSLLFLLAGYETSSSLLSFAVHVLATELDIQEKLREHINTFTEGREVTYEVLSQMTYLDWFIMETLRLYPPVARLERKCTKKYTLPGTEINIDVGDLIGVSIYGIHMDPDIYPEPEEFRPERFNEKEKKNRPSHLFLGFGAGPRNCIGLRFALISAKLAIIAVMKNFKFSTCDKTVDPVKFDKRSFLLKSESGLWVHVNSL